MRNMEWQDEVDGQKEFKVTREIGAIAFGDRVNGTTYGCSNGAAIF